MTRTWKLKTTSVNNSLVLIILILVKAGWTESERDIQSRKLINNPEPWTSNTLKTNESVSFAGEEETDLDQMYLNGVGNDTSVGDDDYVKNGTVNSAEDEYDDAQLYDSDLNSFYGESVADTLFHASTNNISLIFADLSKCLYDFKFLTCLKMLLLNRVNNMLFIMERNNLTKTDLYLLNGYVAFKVRNETDDVSDESDEMESKVDDEISDDGDDDEPYLNLDEELSDKIIRLFRNRSLQITLLPGFGLDIKPMPKSKDDEFVCFSTRTFVEPDFNTTAVLSEMRGQLSSKDGGGGGQGSKNQKKKKKKGGGFDMMPMMIIPQMVMIGFMPFALANLKMMVMNAFMMNMMALGRILFTTIRNLVFGPKGGPKIKYVNYGYKHKKKSKKPEIIIHSPAAFVKQPEVYHKKPLLSDHHLEPPFHHSHPQHLHLPHSESLEDASGPYPQSHQFGSSETEDSFDYDHSLQHGGEEPSFSIKHQDDNFGEFSNPTHHQFDNKIKRIIVRNKHQGFKRKDRIRIKPGKLPAEVKTIMDQLNKHKKPDSKLVPVKYYKDVKPDFRLKSPSTTHKPSSVEESDEESSQETSPNYYPNYPPLNQYPELPKPTEKTNAWSVQYYPESNPLNYYRPRNPFSEPEIPDLDIVKLMPDVKSRIYGKPTTESNFEGLRLGSFNEHRQTFSDYDQLHKNQIDRIYSTKYNQNEFKPSESASTFMRNDGISTDYRTVFSSKYNKDRVNFENKYLNEQNKHKNHNYSRL